MKIPVFTGASAALITPFKNGGVDFGALEKILQKQISAGSEAVTVCATTGEAPTLSRKEYISVLCFVRELTYGKCKVIAGSGANNTKEAIEKSIIAEHCGADALLIVTPYYNKTTQTGLFLHYEAVASSTRLPIILYNVPSRTGLSFTAETYEKLSKIENINGVKEASGNMELIEKTAALCKDDLNIWSGNDNDTVPIMALGGKGVISVAANLIPNVMMKITDYCDDSEYDKARKTALTYFDLIDKMFIAVNPIPIKEMLSLEGLSSPEVRLPLAPLDQEKKYLVRNTFEYYKNRALI